MRNSLSAEEANVINRLMPGNEELGVGTKLKYLLGFATPPGGVVYVDGDNGDDAAYDGSSWDAPFKTIRAAITAVNPGGVVVIKPKKIPAGATDPVDYAEVITIPVTKPGISLVGYGNRTQGGMPQIKKGSGAAAQITIQAPGCTIAGLGINGAGATGGGILLDDDGLTKSAFGTTIRDCHFKNCKGHATDGTKGGAITWSSNGGGWQVRIIGNRFYKNLADIVLLGTGGSIPQDVVIEENVFSGIAASTDVNLWLKGGGSGMLGLVIRRNRFGALPSAGGGTVGRYMDLTECIDTLTKNVFNCTKLTFKNASINTRTLVPATMFIAGNFQQVAAGAGATGEIGYTA